MSVRIWLPIWTLKASSFIFLSFLISLKKKEKFLIEIPNLLFAFPVDIFLWVLASISGFNLNPIETFLFDLLAILLIILASLSDSQFINNIFLLIAIFNSSSVLPTPEKTILFALIPAFKAFSNSPIETTSVPAPNFPRDLRIDKLLLDFAAKQINGFIFLNVLTNFI